MDLIYDAAAKFLVLEQFEYHFVVSQKRRLQTINLNFIDTDFFHIAGLHYLTDITIPRDRIKTMDEILIKHTITDVVLNKSVHYVSRDSKTDVKSRIEELRFLEEYLDTDNFMILLVILSNSCNTVNMCYNSEKGLIYYVKIKEAPFCDRKMQMIKNRKNS